MIKQITVLFTVLISFLGFSQDVQTFFTKTNAFLEANVSQGKVAYSSIYKSQDELNDILNFAEGIVISKNDAKIYQAFWINAYNLLVIKGIIDNYPTKSPLDNKGFFDKTMYKIGKKKLL